MAEYEVYATRWDDPHIIEELIPARGLEFSLPLNDHGECSFSATVEPGRSFWRPSISPVASGVLITRDNVPVWSGMVWSENQTGPRTFDFQCAEWGSVFEKVPVPPGKLGGFRVVFQPLRFVNQPDVIILRSLVELAQEVDGQNFLIETNPDASGVVRSDYTVNPWDAKTVDDAIREVANADGGPDWYFHTTGTKENPVRRLVVGEGLGYEVSGTVLEYVEDTEAYRPPEAPPQLTLLGNLFPGPQPQARTGKGGGNVIAHPARTRDGAQSATVALALGAGEERAQIRATATSTLIACWFPSAYEVHRVHRCVAADDVATSRVG